MPTIAATVPELLGLLDGSGRLEGDGLVVTDETAFRAKTIVDLAWTATFGDDAAIVEAARWLVWEASQVARRPLGEHPGPLHGPRPRRVRAASPSRPSTSAPRRSTWRGSSSRQAMAKDVGPVILELARSRADLHATSASSSTRRTSSPGAIAAGWRGPVFIQGDHYQFNAKKYAADPEAMTEEIRRACRDAIAAGYRNIDIDSSTLVDLSQADRRRAAAGELHPCGRAHGPHPRSRAGRRDDQRRRRDRRGRQAELDRAGAARPTSTATAASSTPAGRAPSGVARSASRPAPATAACRCPAAASPRSSSTSSVLRVLGQVARAYGAGRCGPARREHAARRAVPPLPRRWRPPRSTSRRASRTPLYEHPAFPADAAVGDRGVVLRQRCRRAQGGPDGHAVRLHDPQEGDRAVQAPALELCDQGRDPRRPGRQDRLPVRPAQGLGHPRAPRPLHLERARVAPAAAGRPADRRRRLTAPSPLLVSGPGARSRPKAAGTVPARVGGRWDHPW